MSNNTFSCNGNIFKYNNNYSEKSDTTFLLIIIIICFLTLLFFLYKMFKLCSFAFSYSHYHIHSTYRVYALAIITIITTMLFRNNQWNLHDTEIKMIKYNINIFLVKRFMWIL